LILNKKTPEIPPEPPEPVIIEEPKVQVSRGPKTNMKVSNSNTNNNQTQEYQNKYFKFPFRIKTPELYNSYLKNFKLPLIKNNSHTRGPVGLHNSIESNKFYSDLNKFRLPEILGALPPNTIIDDKYSRNFDLTKSQAETNREDRRGFIKIPKLVADENVKSKLRKLIKKDKLICKSIVGRERVKVNLANLDRNSFEASETSFKI